MLQWRFGDYDFFDFVLDAYSAQRVPGVAERDVGALCPTKSQTLPQIHFGKDNIGDSISGMTMSAESEESPVKNIT